MAKRVQVYLDDENYEYLKARSDRERRKPGNLASLWVTERIQIEKQQTENTQNSDKFQD
jgi:hypothetical protein